MRTWVDDRRKKPVDKRWVMRCDGRPEGQPCTTVSEPFPDQPELHVFKDRGWFIAALAGDLCPVCVAAGLDAGAVPHAVMADRAAAGGGVSQEVRLT